MKDANLNKGLYGIVYKLYNQVFIIDRRCSAFVICDRIEVVRLFFKIIFLLRNTLKSVQFL